MLTKQEIDLCARLFVLVVVIGFAAGLLFAWIMSVV